MSMEDGCGVLRQRFEGAPQILVVAMTVEAIDEFRVRV
jgi:hypothetical protein